MSLTSLERALDRIAERGQTFGWFLAAALVALFAKLAGSVGADPDLFARVAMGRLVERDGAVPAADPFAFTPKKEFWIDHEWLSGAVFHWLAQAGGDRALFAFKLLACALTVYLLLRAQRTLRQGITFGGVLLSFILILDCTYLWASTVRAQVFTYLFIALYYFLFAKYENTRRAYWLWHQPLTMALWSNLHGGFVLGLIMQIFFAARQREPRLWMLPALSLGATLLNPYGTAYWGFMLQALSMQRPTITEWAPVLPFSLGGLIPYLFLALFMFGWLKNSGRSWFLLFETAFFAYCALRHERMSALFSMVLVARGSAELERGLAELGFSAPVWKKARRAFILVACAGLAYCTALAAVFAAHFRSFELDYSAYPVQAVEALKETSGGKLLVDFNNGSFALWRLYPRFQISLDGRYEEVYPDGTAGEVSAALDCANPRQRELTAKISPDFILSRKGARCFSEWHEIYSDAAWTIYGRSPGRLNPPAKITPMWSPGF